MQALRGFRIRDIAWSAIAATTSLNVVSIPGANAAVTALSASGLPTDEFFFAGLPAVEKERTP